MITLQCQFTILFIFLIGSYDYTRFFFFFHFIGNGYISTDVLKEILQELDAKLTNEDLDNIIEEVDEDGSGTLGIKDLISRNDSIALWFTRSEFLKNSWSRLRLF